MTENAQQPTAEEVRRADVEETLSVVSTLTGMQRRFLLEYLAAEKPNAARAAERSGYSNPRQSGSRLLKNPKIREAIDEFFYAQEMSAREVIARLSSQARGSMADFIRFPVNEQGEDIWGIDPHLDLRKAQRAGKLEMIKKFRQKRTVRIDKDGAETQDEYTEIELYDAQAALVHVGRYHGLFTEKIDANVATNDSGMTVEEWKQKAAERRQQAAATAALFEDGDDDVAAED